MAETLHKLQHIYAKWETRNPRQGNFGHPAPSQTHPDGCRSISETGKQAWTRKFGNIGPAPVRRQKYSRGKPTSLSTALVTSSSLGFFKSTPTVLPSIAQVRPLLGRCCTCMPSCREELYNEGIKEMQLQNLLRSSTQIHCNGATKTFGIYQFLRDNCSYKYPDVTAATRRSERVRQAIETSIHSELDAEESDAVCVAHVRTALRQHRRYVSNTLRQMKARVSDRLLRFSTWLLHRLLACVFSAVLVHSGQMTMLQKASEREVPMVFIPTRRSYFDHILLSFVLVSHGMRAPHVALGSESRISMFSRIFQWLGAFFVESSPDSVLANSAVYNSVLCSYIEELLRRHQHMGLSVEGWRSNSGRVLHPTAGVLSGVLSAYYGGATPDVYIVPVSVSYEKLPEGTFSDRQMGGVEAAPSLTGALWCVWKLLRQSHSSVRVDFCQPFLLREFLHVASSFERIDSGDIQRTRDGEMEDSEDEDVTAMCLCDVGDSEDVVLSDEHVNTAAILAQHVVYDCMNAQAVMSTHLLAFLLLNKYRQGARLPNLMSSFDWLKKEVIAHSRDLGFTGSTEAVVEHACRLLEPGLVKQCPATQDTDHSETNTAACIQPIITLPGVLDLAYYAQTAASVFVMESIVANVIHSMADTDQRSTDSDLDRSIPLSKDAILEQCKTLCVQLKYDYVFMPPCASLDSLLVDALEQFLLCEVLQEGEANNYTDSRERAWAQRVSASLGVYDEDQEEDEWGIPDTLYKVNLSTPYTAEKFEFLRGVIAPTLETHYVTSCCLATLLDGPRTESEFIANTLHVLIGRAETGVATYAESASLDGVNNAIRSFVHQTIIQCYYDNDNDLKTVCLRGKYCDQTTLEKFIASMERYRT